MKKMVFVIVSFGLVLNVSSQPPGVLEELFTQPFPHPLAAEVFKDELGLFSGVSYEQVQNVHYPEISDTLVHVKYMGSNIHLYQAEEKTLLYKFHIKHRRIKLIHNIHKGMKRDELAAVLTNPVPPEEDTVAFVDAEKTVKIEFIFNARDKLKVINYESLIF